MTGPEAPLRDDTSPVVTGTSDARPAVDLRHRREPPRWSIAERDAWAALALALLVNALLLIWLLQAVNAPAPSAEWQSNGIRIVWIERTRTEPQKLPAPASPDTGSRRTMTAPAKPRSRTAPLASTAVSPDRNLPQAPPLPAVAGDDR